MQGLRLTRLRVCSRTHDRKVAGASHSWRLVPAKRNWRTSQAGKEAVEALGLAGGTPHDLRRTFGGLARSAGTDLRWIQRAMGHASITTTARIYAHLYDNELDRSRRPSMG
jgi:integrase